MDIESYVEALARDAMKSEPERERPKNAESEPKPEEKLEAVLRGRGIELWSDALGERFWLVADEEDAARLGEPRGTIYTAAEVRRVIQIGDAATVAEIHEWKRRFDGRLRGEECFEPTRGCHTWAEWKAATVRHGERRR